MHRQAQVDQQYRSSGDLSSSRQDRSVLEASLVRQVMNMFLDGAIESFDYTCVDTDERLDDTKLMQQDAEAQYFDEEDGDDDDVLPMQKKSNERRDRDREEFEEEDW